MSALILPKLYWRLGATPQIPATAAATDIIATLKSQIQGLNYWQLVESPNTGSTSLILKPISAPTVNSSQFSSASNMNIVIAYNITGTVAYRSPDNATVAGATQYKLQVGLTPDVTQGGSGSFKGPNADRPFQTATGNPRWSGYWHCAPTGSISASYILESLENIFVGFKDKTSASGTYGFWAGVLAETPDSGSGENNRRLYGMATTGPAVMSNTFWSQTTAFLGHSTVTDTAHMGVFAVSGGYPVGDATSGLGSNVWWTAYCASGYTPAYDDFATWTNNSNTPGSRQVAIPFPITGISTSISTAPTLMLGTARGLYVASSDRGGLIRIQSGGIDQVYKVTATHNQVSNYAFIVGPATGSGL